MSQSCDFVARLKSDVENSSKKAFSQTPKELQKLEACWGDLAHTAVKFKNALNASLKQVAKTIDPQLREIAEFFNHAEFVLSERDYQQRQVMKRDLNPKKLFFLFL